MIPDPPAIGVYVLAALALLIVPGPSVLYIVARSMHHGRRAGLVSVLGIHVGSLVHVSAATLGLSALVSPRPWRSPRSRPPAPSI